MRQALVIGRRGVWGWMFMRGRGSDGHHRGVYEVPELSLCEQPRTDAEFAQLRADRGLAGEGRDVGGG
jgi:hypothetical protein